MRLWRALLGQQKTQEIARYSVSQYANDIALAYNGHRYLLSGGSAGYNKTEDVETSFTGFISGLYKSNGIVFAIILARMLLFCEARFAWFEINENGEDGRPKGRDGLDVLERPWPNGGTGELLARMEQDVSLGGNFYAIRDGNRLRRLRPDWVTIVLTAPPAESSESEVAGYWYHPGRNYSNAGEPAPGDDVYLPGEVCHWSPLPDPDAQYRGMSWLAPMVREVQADKSAMEHKLAFFTNGATFGAIVSAKESLTNTQYKEWKANFEGVTSGAGNAYKTLFLASPVDTSVMTANMQQLDFKVTVGAGETRLCAAGGVPPIIVGLSEGLASATYSNYGMARRKFGDHWAHPQWKSASQALAALVDAPAGDVRLGVNTKGIAFLREDAKDLAEIQQIKASTLSTLIMAGYTPDSAAAAVDAEDLSLLEHTGLTSVQLVPPGTAEGAPEDEEAGDEYEALLAEEDVFAEEDGMERARYNIRNPEGSAGGGRFRRLSDAIVALLRDNDGHGDPLEHFTQAQLRTAARQLGLVEPRQRTTRRQLKLALAKHARRDRGRAGRLSGQHSTAPVLDNNWGGIGGEVAFHEDGAIGQALRRMGNDRLIDVDGEPLANVVGRLATQTVRGERTMQQLVADLRALRDRLPDREPGGDFGGSLAREALDGALRDMTTANRVDVNLGELPDGTPEPIRRLMAALEANPLARRETYSPDRETEVEQLDSLARLFVAGDRNATGRRLVDAIRNLANQRHESREGKFELDRAVRVAVAELEAMLRADRRSLDGPDRRDRVDQARQRQAAPPASRVREVLLSLRSNDDRREYLAGLDLTQAQANALARDLGARPTRISTDATLDNIVQHFDLPRDDDDESFRRELADENEAEFAGEDALSDALSREPEASSRPVSPPEVERPRSIAELRSIGEAESIPLPRRATREQLEAHIRDFRFHRDNPTASQFRDPRDREPRPTTADHVATLEAMTTREQATAYLEGVRGQALTDLARRYSATHGRTAPDRRRLIVEAAVGNRLDSFAINGGARLPYGDQPHVSSEPRVVSNRELGELAMRLRTAHDLDQDSAIIHARELIAERNPAGTTFELDDADDGLDELDTRDLVDLALEYDVSTARDRTRAQLLTALRARSVSAPDTLRRRNATPERAGVPLSDLTGGDEFPAPPPVGTQPPDRISGRRPSAGLQISLALQKWSNGDGPDEPLVGKFTRDQLRREAVARGLTVRRGATDREIADALKDETRQNFQARQRGRADLRPMADLMDPMQRTTDDDVRAVFEGNFGGMTTRVEQVYRSRSGERPYMSVAGRVFDSSGREVGTFRRSYNRNTDGDLVAHHEFLQINSQVQGSGFSNAFNGHLIRWYRQSGAKAVHVHADIDVGGYAWARMGYDFANDYSAEHILALLNAEVERLERQRRSASRGGDWREEIRQARELLLRAGDRRFGEPGFPTPYEISQLGRWDSAGRMDRWIGKRILLGSDWYGVLRL